MSETSTAPAAPLRRPRLIPYIPNNPELLAAIGRFAIGRRVTTGLSRSATGLQMFESSIAFLRAPNLPATA